MLDKKEITWTKDFWKEDIGTYYENGYARHITTNSDGATIIRDSLWKPILKFEKGGR